MSSDLLVVKNSVRKTITSDWKYSVGAGEEKATASGSYKDDFQSWADRCPLIGSAHPDIPGMSLVNIDATREEGDVVKIDLKYEATLRADYPGRPPGSEVIKRYTCAGADGEEHILTHTRYKDLEENELKALFAISNGTEAKDADDGGGLYQDDITTLEGLECLAKIRRGTVARKSTGMVWIEKYTTADLAELDLDNVHKTMLPPGKVGEVGGEAKNWLYLTPNAEEQTEGGVFAIEKRWEYSADGWDEDMYPAAT